MAIKIKIMTGVLVAIESKRPHELAHIIISMESKAVRL